MEIEQADSGVAAAVGVYTDMMEALAELTMHTSSGPPISFRVSASHELFDYTLHALGCKSPSTISCYTDKFVNVVSYIKICGVYIRKCSDAINRPGYWFTVTIPTT